MPTKLVDNYLCKGPRLTDREEIAKAYIRLMRSNERALQRANKSPEEIAETLKGIESDFMRDPRRACGFRMNEALEALPEDGLEYDAVCPQCGTVTRAMRTPPDPV